MFEFSGGGHIYDLSGEATFNGHTINNTWGRDILMVARVKID
jgi:hypothetical protein